jgi:hypothetical protein
VVNDDRVRRRGFSSRLVTVLVGICARIRGIFILNGLASADTRSRLGKQDASGMKIYIFIVKSNKVAEDHNVTLAIKNSAES